MMRKIQYSILLIASISLIAGCVSDFNVNLPESDESILVVEGYILENSESRFSFSRSFSINESAPPLEFNEIKVNLYIVGDNGYRSEPASYQGAGIHQINVGQLDDNVSYGIEFEYEGDTYLSNLSKPVYTPEIDQISWEQPKEYGDISLLLSTHNDDEKASYFTWKYVEDWEFPAEYWVTVFYDAEEKEFNEEDYAYRYYCWNKYEGHEILIGSTEKLKENRLTNHKLYDRSSSNNRFSILYSVRIYQRALSKAAYEYYLDLLKANEGMGGLFSPQPSGIEGNITCISDKSKKVIGFVDVSKNTTEKQLYINRSEISRKNPYAGCPLITNDSIKTLMKELEISQHDVITGLQYHPILTSLMGPPDSWTWTYIRCLDCTLNGGTKNKPSFWPNTHE